MSFTNPWDSTQPPDSQFVNQGAADFRTLRTDIQQRVSAVSGVDAFKPDFASDAQPTAWAGVLFFALDTHKVYQWSGSAWNDVTSSIGGGAPGPAGPAGPPGPTTVLDRNITPTVHSNNVNESTVYSTSLPALGPNAILRVTTSIELGGGGQAIPHSTNFRWRLNGAQIGIKGYTGAGNAPPPTGIANTIWVEQLYLWNQGTTNAQYASQFGLTEAGWSGSPPGFGLAGTTNGIATVQTNVPTVLTFSVQDSALGNSQTALLWLVEIF